MKPCSSIFNRKVAEYKPVQYAKNDYRVLKKENRYTGTFMIRQKSNGFFIPDEKVSVDMDIIISSLKVPYLRVSYYGTEQLSIPDGQTLSFFVNGKIFKNWKNNLLVTSLKFENLYRLEILDNKVLNQEMIYSAGSRIRDVETGPEGWIYLAVEDPGRIIRLKPPSK